MSSNKDQSSDNEATELFNLSVIYTDKIEKFATMTTKAVGQLSEIIEDYEKKEAAFKSSWHQILLSYLKALMPFLIVLAFLVALFHLPCGISFEGFWGKLSTAACPVQSGLMAE